MEQVKKIQDVLKVERYIIFDVLFALIVFIAFIERSLNMITGNALKIFGFTDELIQVFAISILVLGLFIDLISPRFFLVFLYMIGFHIASKYAAPYYRGPIDTFIASMIQFKLMLFIVALTTGAKHMLIWRQLFNFFIILSVFGLFAHIALGTSWNQIFKSVPSYRYGLLRHHGFYKTSNAQAFFITIYAIHLLTKHRNVNLILLPIVTVVSAVIFLIFTSTRTSIIVIVITAGYMLLHKENFFMKYVIIAVVAVGLVGFMAVKGEEVIATTERNLEFATSGEEEEYVRGIVILYSFKVAAMYYPFGSGFGTYCSVTAAGSRVYRDVNIPRYRLFEHGLEGVYDSSFATLLGELGYLGMYLYYFIFIILLRSLKKGQSKNNRFFIDMLIVSSLFFSFTNPIFSNTYPSIIIALFLVVRLKGRDNHNLYPPGKYPDKRPEWMKYLLG